MNISAQKSWRAGQIAMSEISKYDSTAQITPVPESQCRFYDLLVESSAKGLRYGIEIKRSEFERTKLYADYLEKLSKHQSEIDVPILLVSVNESSEEVKLGIVFSWFHNRPSITKDIVLWKSSQESWNKALDLLAISAHVEGPIRFLQLDDLWVKKTLPLRVENPGCRTFLAELVYMRKLSPEYRMNTKERDSIQKQLHFYLHGYDKEEYPSDNLDEAIINAVNSHDGLNKTDTQNHLIVLNTELRDLQLYRECRRGQVIVRVTPNLDDMSDAAIRLLSGYTEIQIPVELYANTVMDRDYFNNMDFTYKDNADGWVGKVLGFRKALVSFKKLSDIIG